MRKRQKIQHKFASTGKPFLQTVNFHEGVFGDDWDFTHHQRLGKFWIQDSSKNHLGGRIKSENWTFYQNLKKQWMEKSFSHFFGLKQTCKPVYPWGRRRNVSKGGKIGEAWEVGKPKDDHEHPTLITFRGFSLIHILLFMLFCLYIL